MLRVRCRNSLFVRFDPVVQVAHIHVAPTLFRRDQPALPAIDILAVRIQRRGGMLLPNLDAAAGDFNSTTRSLCSL